MTFVVGITPESARLGAELRQKIVGLGRGNYRAVFSIDRHNVLVLAVRHASQDDLTDDVSGQDA